MLQYVTVAHLQVSVFTEFYCIASDARRREFNAFSIIVNKILAILRAFAKQSDNRKHEF